MALQSPRAFLPLLFVPLFSFISTATAAGFVGVNYGRVADNLMPPAQVVNLLKANHIRNVHIYDADRTVLRAFSGSGINMSVTLPNERLYQAASSPAFAFRWVRTYVVPFAHVARIRAIAVGNEVFHCCHNLTSYLVPAMRNIANALDRQGLGNAIRVSTPIAFDAVNISFPPSSGTFRRELQPVIRQIMDLVRHRGSYMTVNIYTYQTYINDTSIALDYALGHARHPVVDPISGLKYYSLFDAQLDAFYSAMYRLRYGDTFADGDTLDPSTFAASMKAEGNRAQGGESGFPSHNPTPPPPPPPHMSTAAAGGGYLNASLQEDRRRVANRKNAQMYNTNLIQRILAGQTGTPLYPRANMDLYIFSLFNENLKPGLPTERFYGLFYPNGSKVYKFTFQRERYTPTPMNPPAPRTWCEAVPAVGRTRLQAALEWACGEGKVDCRPIQPGGRCFEPNTVEAHATFAFNSYYQKHRRFPGDCEFNGAGRVVTQRPRSGNCLL